MPLILGFFPVARWPSTYGRQTCGYQIKGIPLLNNNNYMLFYKFVDISWWVNKILQ